MHKTLSHLLMTFSDCYRKRMFVSLRVCRGTEFQTPFASLHSSMPTTGLVRGRLMIQSGGEPGSHNIYQC